VLESSTTTSVCTACGVGLCELSDSFSLISGSCHKNGTAGGPGLPYERRGNGALSISLRTKRRA
jgi:hypothetical protein